MTDRRVVRIGHSPDPDDAFMMWALAEGVLTADAFAVETVAADIETLNGWAIDGAELDATALSAAAMARAADRYWLLPHGGSFGQGYGPVVVARAPLPAGGLRDVTVLTPGDHTTATTVLKLAHPGIRTRTMRFDRILPAVRDGKADAGLVIHEGQLTFGKEGLHNAFDLAAWWRDETGGLPLPLGVTAVRKDLGAELAAEVNALMRASIDTGLALRDRALRYARTFGRGVSDDDAARFVDMYVNDLTRDMGVAGRRAIDALHRRMRDAGLAPDAHVAMAPEPPG